MTIFMYTHFMLGIDIYCTITIPAWFIPCNYIVNSDPFNFLHALSSRFLRSHTFTFEFRFHKFFKALPS